MTEWEKHLVNELCIHIKYVAIFEGSPVFNPMHDFATNRIKEIKDELGIEDDHNYTQMDINDNT